MVKLRGVNVYPQGVGALLSSQFAETNGEYICIVSDVDGRTEMAVKVEVTSAPDGLRTRMEELLKSRLGVQITVEPVPPGGTVDLTQLQARQKPLRLIKS